MREWVSTKSSYRVINQQQLFKNWPQFVIGCPTHFEWFEWTAMFIDQYKNTNVKIHYKSGEEFATTIGKIFFQFGHTQTSYHMVTFLANIRHEHPTRVHSVGSNKK